jgi:Na+/H+ antiporter NhaB
MKIIEALNDLKAATGDKQGEAIGLFFERVQDDFLTKPDLESALDKFKLEMQRWIFIALIIQLALMVTIIGIINGVVFITLTRTLTHLAK